jgi:hypothetical protein
MPKTYKCKDCGREVTIKDTNSAPDCCGHRMQEIPENLCAKHHTAEGARLQDKDDACDDGVR